MIVIDVVYVVVLVAMDIVLVVVIVGKVGERRKRGS